MDVEKILAKQANTYREMAQFQAPTKIGELVLEMIARGEQPSAPALIAEIETRLAATEPKGQPKLDIGRMLLEAALAAIKASSPSP